MEESGEASFFELMSTRTKVLLIVVAMLGAVIVLRPFVWLEAWPVLLLGSAAFLLLERREKAAQEATVIQARARMLERVTHLRTGGGAADGGDDAAVSAPAVDAANGATPADEAWPFTVPLSSLDIVEAASASGELERARALFAQRGTRASGRRAAGGHAGLGGGHRDAAQGDEAPEKRLYQGRTKRGKPVKTIKSRDKTAGAKKDN